MFYSNKEMEFNTKAEFLDLMYKQVREEYILTGRYCGPDVKTSFRHKLCGEIIRMTPNEFIKEFKRCPNCSKKDSVHKKIQGSTRKVFEFFKDNFPRDRYKFNGKDGIGYKFDIICKKHNISSYLTEKELHLICKEKKYYLCCPHCSEENDINSKEVLSEMVRKSNLIKDASKKCNRTQRVELLNEEFNRANKKKNENIGNRIKYVVENMYNSEYELLTDTSAIESKRQDIFILHKFCKTVIKISFSEFISNNYKGCPLCKDSVMTLERYNKFFKK